MGKFSNYFMVLGVFLLAGCASQPASQSNMSQGSDSNQEVAEISESDEDPNELICRREQITGTNFRRRVCMTRAERREQRAIMQDEVLRQRSADR